MATLQGQEIKDTYQSLLKTDGNTNINGTLQAITDGQGNATALSLSSNTLFVSGAISNSTLEANAGWYLNNGGTSGSQYFLYNSANRSIYLNAWVGDYEYEITSSLVDKYPAGNPIAFVHTTLGLLTGSIESSYFYNGEGDDLTIITLTTDPSNGVSDDYGGPTYPPAVYYDTTIYSVIFGTNNIASYWGHAEGWNTTAIGQYSHTEGWNTISSGSFTHAEGDRTIATGIAGHAEGSVTRAIGAGSHAEGVRTTAIGGYSHAEGDRTTAIGAFSHAEGSTTTSVGRHSHAEGWDTISEGSFNGSSGIPQHAEGRYNVPDATSLLIVGNGTADNTRSNAFSIATFGTNNTGSTAVLPFVSQSLNYANDAAAAAGGIPLGGLYHSSGTIKIRLV